MIQNHGVLAASTPAGSTPVVLMSDDFETGIANWEQGMAGGWAGSGGKAECNLNPANTTVLYRPVPITPGETYEVTTIISEIDAGTTFRLMLGGYGGNNPPRYAQFQTLTPSK